MVFGISRLKSDAGQLSEGTRMLKCSAYIAASVDGYIATHEGGVEWLESAGNPEMGDREPVGDGGFSAYMASVDCMVIGRKCMEKIASFNLSPEQWPYGDIPIYVLSKTVRYAPESLRNRVSMFSGDIPALLGRLTSDGYKHAYVDGGATITSFIQFGLLDEICVTQVPILLGDGLPLFGKIGRQIKLENAEATVFSNDFIQWKYCIS
nr:putative dihydrofolate reductase [uncultured bacterium]